MWVILHVFYLSVSYAYCDQTSPFSSHPINAYGYKNSLVFDSVIIAGEYIYSENGRFKLGMGNDNDLTIWDGTAKNWSANISEDDDVYLKMQDDGNLSVHKAKNNKIIWETTTNSKNNRCSILALDNNGVAKVINPSGHVLWTNKEGKQCRNVAPIASTVILETGDTCPTQISSDAYSRSGKVLVCSLNGKYKLELTRESDLSISDEYGHKLWSAGTCCKADNVYVKMQLNGNLDVYNSSKVIWSSKIEEENIGSVLIMGNDGVATITNKAGNHIWTSAINANETVDSSTLDKKIMAGYQGWFATPSDGGYNKWKHWASGGTTPNINSVTIDMWPDLQELDQDELKSTYFKYSDGSNAGLYSAFNIKTVERHVKWMYDYGIDGVFVQRFINSAKEHTCFRDRVLENIRSGSEKYGRVFANMYDISGGTEYVVYQDLVDDWKHLVDNVKITKSKRYLHHKGKPVLAIWGFGFDDRIGHPPWVLQLIDWFQYRAEEKYRVTLMGGVPTGWRTLTRDSKPDPRWSNVYRSFDVISPWTVGRMNDIDSADDFREKYIEPDLEECQSLGIDYLPVVFPGFSAFNDRLKPFNSIPRLGGTFFWHQLHNAINAGSGMVYIAMFDEVDEGTAIFKIADVNQKPTSGLFLTLNYDYGYDLLPNDWYLKLTGHATTLLREGAEVPLVIPIAQHKSSCWNLFWLSWLNICL